MNVVELTVRAAAAALAGRTHSAQPRLSGAGVGRRALQRTQVPLRARLRRHPVPIDARLENCLTLTYALPPRVLEPLLPPGLELETFGGYGFVAVALVADRSLRPAGLPRVLGQDFFLAGYRVFTTFRLAGRSGRPMRGLRILRSDTDRARMVAGGNLLTHYNYHRCDARIVTEGSRSRVSRPDGRRRGRSGGDRRSVASDAACRIAVSVSARGEAIRRSAAVHVRLRARDPHASSPLARDATNWRPAPVTVDAHHIAFFDDPMFEGCTPILAAAFHVSVSSTAGDRGVRYPIAPCAGLRS